jgi:hypothetical protein
MRFAVSFLDSSPTDFFEFFFLHVLLDSFTEFAPLELSFTRLYVDSGALSALFRAILSDPKSPTFDWFLLPFRDAPPSAAPINMYLSPGTTSKVVLVTSAREEVLLARILEQIPDLNVDVYSPSKLVAKDFKREDTLIGIVFDIFSVVAPDAPPCRPLLFPVRTPARPETNQSYALLMKRIKGSCADVGVEALALLLRLDVQANDPFHLRVAKRSVSGADEGFREYLLASYDAENSQNERIVERYYEHRAATDNLIALREKFQFVETATMGRFMRQLEERQVGFNELVFPEPFIRDHGSINDEQMDLISLKKLRPMFEIALDGIGVADPAFREFAVRGRRLLNEALLSVFDERSLGEKLIMFADLVLEADTLCLGNEEWATGILCEIIRNAPCSSMFIAIITILHFAAARPGLIEGLGTDRMKGLDKLKDFILRTVLEARDESEAVFPDWEKAEIRRLARGN